MRLPHQYLSFWLSLATAIALTVESYLSQINSSICPTKACEIVGNYLSINESLLVAAGASFFWFLTALLYFSFRHCNLKPLPYFALILALALDSSLIGFQYFTIQERCILCISVALALIIIAVLYTISQKNFVMLLCFIFVWIGGFFVHSIMVMPSPQGAYQNMTFCTVETGDKSGKQIKQPTMTLIMSMHCPHCLEVVSYLSENMAENYKVKLATVDKDSEALSKISLFLKNAPSSENPFSLLYELKESEVAQGIEINKSLHGKGQHGLNFLSNLGLSSIPVLVYESELNKKTIVSGSTEIIQFLKSIKQ